MLLRLACPAHGEGLLGPLGQPVVHTLGRPAAPLAGIHHKQRVAAVEGVFPGGIAGQNHNAIPAFRIGLLHQRVRPVHRPGRFDVILQNHLGKIHCPCKTLIRIPGLIPQGIETADGIRQQTAFAGVVVQIQRLHKVLVQQTGLIFPHQLCAELPPQQAESRIRHPVGALGPIRRVMVEGAVANVVNNAVEVLRHREATGHGEVRPQDAQQRGAEHIVRVELAAVGKTVFGYLHAHGIHPHTLVVRAIPHNSRWWSAPENFL